MSDPLTFSHIYMVKLENDIVGPLKLTFYRSSVDDMFNRGNTNDNLTRMTIFF